MKPLFDTNILIDYLNGSAKARKEIGLYDLGMISPITWMEIMVGTDPSTSDTVRRFLNRFKQVPLDETISERAVEIRRATGVKLPDAIIWATAQVADALLITRNTKDFPQSHPGVRIPYREP